MERRERLSLLTGMLLKERRSAYCSRVGALGRCRDLHANPGRILSLGRAVWSLIEHDTGILYQELDSFHGTYTTRAHCLCRPVRPSNHSRSYRPRFCPYCMSHTSLTAASSSNFQLILILIFDHTIQEIAQEKDLLYSNCSSTLRPAPGPQLPQRDSRYRSAASCLKVARLLGPSRLGEHS